MPASGCIPFRTGASCIRTLSHEFSGSSLPSDKIRLIFIQMENLIKPTIFTLQPFLETYGPFVFEGALPVAAILRFLLSYNIMEVKSQPRTLFVFAKHSDKRSHCWRFSVNINIYLGIQFSILAHRPVHRFHVRISASRCSIKPCWSKVKTQKDS